MRDVAEEVAVAAVAGDTLLKFMLGEGNVRGVVVRLEESWREMQRRRTHEGAVRSLLGEMTAASALLAGSLKFDGTLVLQIQGDGPLRLAVAECQPDFGLRATAQADAGAAAAPHLAALANAHGMGRCALTLDPRARKPGQAPYQGIVALTDDAGRGHADLAAVLRQYLEKSEQIPSWVILAADDERACGLLVQRMPDAGGTSSAGREKVDEDFARAMHLAATLGRAELLRETPEALLRRLFWEESPRVFEPRTPHFHCTCSRARVADMLRMLGRDEVESVLEERGQVDVACEFCGAGYAFDLVDAARLFKADIDQPPGPAQPQ